MGVYRPFDGGDLGNHFDASGSSASRSGTRYSAALLGLAPHVVSLVILIAVAGTLFFRFGAPPDRPVYLVVSRVVVSIAAIVAAFSVVQTQLGGITWPWVAGIPGYLVMAYIVRAEGEPPPAAFDFDPEHESEHATSATLSMIEYLFLPVRFVAESLVGLLLLPFPKSAGTGEVEQPTLYGKVCVVPNIAQARFIGARLRAEGIEALPVEGATADDLTRAVDGFAIEVPVDEADHARSWLTDNGYSHFLV